MQPLRAVVVEQMPHASHASVVQCVLFMCVDVCVLWQCSLLETSPCAAGSCLAPQRRSGAGQSRGAVALPREPRPLQAERKEVQ